MPERHVFDRSHTPTEGQGGSSLVRYARFFHMIDVGTNLPGGPLFRFLPGRRTFLSKVEEFRHRLRKRRKIQICFSSFLIHSFFFFIYWVVSFS